MNDFQLVDRESVFLSKEWVMDPPPWIAVKLEERILKDIYRVKAKTLAEVAELEMKIKGAEARMFNEIAAIMEKGG